MSKMSAMRALTLTLLSSFWLVGCNLIQPLEVSSVEGLEKIAIGRNGLEGAFIVVFNNPNAFPIQAKGADVDVYINDQKVGRVSLPEAQVIPRGPGGELTLAFETERGALLEIIEANLMNFLLGEEVKLAVKGNVKGSAFGVGLSVPVEAEQNLKIQL
jgi:LEA14-like dessication related protein